MNYPKRLIEVDLPIKRISAHSRREKSIRYGHISTLHIWWARRPLAACRAVICAALWPDPADEHCPPAFQDAARKAMLDWARDYKSLASAESFQRLVAIQRDETKLNNPAELREALLDFIADFANWDNSTVKPFLDTGRLLTRAAHEALGGGAGTRPLVVDPFAGGGAFPIEAARLDTSAYAGDYNVLAWTINRLQLELLPRCNGKIGSLVKMWGEKFLSEAGNRLHKYYPSDPDGKQVVGYLWARTIKCEGPGCGLEVPIMKTTHLTSKGNVERWVEIYYEKSVLKTRIINQAPIITGTSKRSSVTCPKCGYTTKQSRVASQAISRGFGCHLYAIGVRAEGEKVTIYREPTVNDSIALSYAQERLSELQNQSYTSVSNQIPSEELPYLRSIFNVRVYGIDKWRGLFTDRQLVSALELVSLFHELSKQICSEVEDAHIRQAVTLSIGLSLSNSLQYQCNIATWLSESIKSAFIQGQSLPMKMDFVEANPLIQGLAGGLAYSFAKHRSGIEYLESYQFFPGEAYIASATKPFLPNDSTDLIVTDPPYYDVVPYADCSDFFNVWLHRMFRDKPTYGYGAALSSKDEEIVQLAERNERYKARTKRWFEEKLSEALAQWGNSTKMSGRMILVFAHKQTSAWEALINSVLNAGWVVTASWPIDTENSARMRAKDSAVLSSSIHLVCHRRPSSTIQVGDWRDVLAELPRRIHHWMPRLVNEGIIGADAIFACIGPALEIYSRYSRVEKASGEIVTLHEYLEYVWAAVAKEALTQVFKDADTAGFEPDARLTAMWLWTLNAGVTNSDASSNEEGEADEEESNGKSIKAKSSYVLEYDAARKIAQGLGANLEGLDHVVEVLGEDARLLPVSERTAYLFGKEQSEVPTSVRKKKKEAVQLDLFGELTKVDADDTTWSEKTVKKIGETTLDRVHQAMILFAAGRGEALKRFLVDDGAGRDQRFWRLAQALSALYPSSTSEKRWVDGVLARKKGLGL